jgi:S-adenosylmethionine:tRNA ribosyltransferase-isomerase
MHNEELYKLSSYNYDLPKELIAQHPMQPRDKSRLMVVNRQTGELLEMVFRDLKDFLQTGDSLVFNDTKVFPARLYGTKKDTEAHVEIFLNKQRNDGTWEALARPGKRLRPGTRVDFTPYFSCTILETLQDGSKVVQLFHEGDLFELLQQYGKIPLPMYMKREPTKEDLERYQTVYADKSGSVAAPTAGLHFTNELLTDLQKKGVNKTTLTLHVGIGTLRQPLTVEDIRDHKMHAENMYITPENAERLNNRPSNKSQFCVGTTSCRALETAANDKGIIVPGNYDTNIFIYPGYTFKYVKGLITNFHLPCSSLIMLVSAFAGYELTMEAYRKAVKEKYRFYSYGDAMLII